MSRSRPTSRSSRPAAPRNPRRVSGPASTAAGRAASGQGAAPSGRSAAKPSRPAAKPSRTAAKSATKPSRSAAQAAARGAAPSGRSTASSARGTRAGDAARAAVAAGGVRAGVAAAAAVALPAGAPLTAPRPRAVPDLPRRPTAPGRRRGGVAGSPFVRHLRTLPDHPLLDRLLRSRAWIVLLGMALGGIVAMQVSLLGMNAGISEAVVRSTALEQDRATLQRQISELSDGVRIRDAAKAEGLLSPGAGSVAFLSFRGGSDASRAADRIVPPSDLAKATLAGTAATTTAAGQTSTEDLVAPATAAAADPVATPTAAPTAVATTVPPAATAVPPAATTAPVTPVATVVPPATDQTAGAAAAPTG